MKSLCGCECASMGGCEQTLVTVASVRACWWTYVEVVVCARPCRCGSVLGCGSHVVERDHLGRWAGGVEGCVGGKGASLKGVPWEAGRAWRWWSNGQVWEGTPRKEDSGPLGTSGRADKPLRPNRWDKAWAR